MSWFGNSFSGKNAWVQRQVFNCCALPDGTLVAISLWDERHKEIGFYKDGKSLGLAIAGGGSVITTDGLYLYAAAMSTKPNLPGIRRLELDGGAAHLIEDVCFDLAGTAADVLGIAVGGAIVCYGQDAGRSSVYDAGTGALKRMFPVPSAQRLAYDRGGKLWVGAEQYSTDGTPTGKRLDGVSVLALASTGKAGWLSPTTASHKLIIYDIAGPQPQEVATVGVRGGVYALRGEARWARTVC